MLRVWIPGIAHEGTAKRLVLYSAFAFSAIVALPLTGKPRTIWAMSPNYFCMIPALVCRIVSRSKVIHDVVDIWPEALVATGYKFPKGLLRLVDFFSKVAYTLSDTIITLSASMKEVLQKTVPFSKQVIVVENSVKSDFFRVGAKPGGTPFHIMYLGTLSPSNDFPTLLDAASKLQHERGVRFSIVGSGEQAEQIWRLLREKKLSNVDFREGPVSHNDVTKHLAEADAMVLPLRAGFGDTSFPSKFGEYLATGRPVVCMTDGSLARIIATNEIGLIVQPWDSAGLVQAIESLQKDEDQRSELGALGRKFAEMNFSELSFRMKVHKILDLAQSPVRA